MPVISDAEYEIFSKQIGSISERFTGFESSLESMRKKTDLAALGIKDDTDLAKSYSRLMRDRKEREKELLDAQKKGKATAEETRASLKLLNDQTKSAVPPEFRRSADAYISAQEQITNDTIATNEILNGKFVKSISAAASGLTSFAGGMLKSYQGTSNGLDMALDTATMAVDAAGSGMSAVGKGLMSAAPGLLALGPEMAPVVVGLEFLGGALNAAAAATEAVGKVMPFMNKEVQMVSAAFKTASNSGAVFADGFTGLKNASQNAGLDVQTFSASLKENKENIAQAFGGVTAGARKIGDVTKKLDVTQFQKLGFGLEEIPGLIADVGARIKKSVGGGGASDAQLAEATAQYAKNLRIIADITGEDARVRTAEIDKKNQEASYQVVVANEYSQSAQLITDNMNKMPKLGSDMLRELIANHGNITTEAMNYAKTLNPAIFEVASKTYEALKAGTLNENTALEATVSNRDAIIDGFKSMGDAAFAGKMAGGELQQATTDVMNSYQEVLKFPATIEELRTTLQRQAEAPKTKDTTTDQLATLEQQGMEQRVKLQNITTDSLGAYMSALTKINEATLAFAKGFSDVVDTMTGKNKDKLTEQEKQTGQTIASKTELSDKKTGILSVLGIGTNEKQDLGNDLTRMTMDKVEELAKLNNTTVEEMAKKTGYTVESLATAQKNYQADQLAAINAAAGEVDSFMTASPVNPPSPTVATAPNESDKQKEPEVPKKSWWQSIFGGDGSAGGNILSGSAEGFFSKLHGTETVIPLPAGMSGDSFKQLLEVAIGALSNKDKPAVAPSNSDTKISQDSLNSLTGSMTSSFTPLTTGINDFSNSVNTISSTMTNFAKSTVQSIASYIESANQAFDPLVKKDSDTASSFDAIKSQITRFVDIVPTLAPKVTPDENAVDPMTYGITQVTDAISSMMDTNNPTDSISALITQSKEQAATIQDQISKMITDSSGINSGDISTLIGNISGSISGSIKELIASGSQATDESTAMLLQQMPELTDSLTNAVTPMSDGMDSLMKSIMEQTGSLADFIKSSSVTGDMFSKFLDSTQTDPNTNNENTISSYIDSINHIFDPFVQKKVDDTVPQNPDTTISDNISSFGSDLSSLSNTLIEQFSKLLENNTGTKESMDNLVTKVTPVEELMVREPRTDELLEILNRQVAELISLTSSVATHTETTSLRIM